jgi:threonine/homoserine/homoserine lactone efflux protein
MQESQALMAIALAMVIGAMSPGPSFIMVARTSVSSSRGDGLSASLGMGVGGAIFALAALLGLQGILTAVPSLYLVLKILGGAYLAYIGHQIWRGADQPVNIGEIDEKSRANIAKSFFLGLSTQISNPKTAIVYASVFAAFLPEAHTIWFSVWVVVAVFIIEFAWYAIVALALSSEKPRGAYLRYKKWVDRAAGGVMAALGLKLMLSARNA